MKRFRSTAPAAFGLAVVAVLSTACTLGPAYVRPAVPVPAAYKEAGPSGAVAEGDRWKQAQPGDGAPRGPWWEVFGDPGLDALEREVATANLTIAQAEAQLRSARALARSARADQLPTVGVSPSVARSQGGAGRLSSTPGVPSQTVTSYQLPGSASWEADLFGRTRRSVESNVEGARASAAQLEAVRLAVQAQLAVDWFTLHGLDAERQLLDSTVSGYEKSLELTRNRHGQGVVSGVDVAQAEAQLETTRAQATDLGIVRAQLEHAIAVLLGRAPADLTIAPEPIRVAPPLVPRELPSDLLERRPDIASAERRVAAANAEVGVATAAFFPSLLLTASGGYGSSSLASFFSLPNRFWSLGAALAETLFDGGRRRALKEQALASYDGTVDAYRLSVLTAFEEVEDDLAALGTLELEATQQARAVEAAERLLKLARNRYESGVTTYLEVVTAQATALGNERAAVDLQTRRMVASVNLIRALGGGWRASELPSPAAVLARETSPPRPKE